MPEVTTETVDRVLAMIESGESEAAACKANGVTRSGFRSRALILSAGDRYARACEGLARDQVEKLDAAIQDMRDGTIPPEVARIEIEARKWFASRLHRTTWGDKSSTELTGKDGAPLELSDTQITAKIAAIMSAAAKAKGGG